MRHHPGLGFVAVTLLSASTPSIAAPCSASEDELAWNGVDLAEIGGDTGWFPSSFPAQLRLVGRVVGETAVSASTSSSVCWTEAMSGRIDGTRGSGYLDVAYGADIHLYAKVDTSILGKAIYWSGEIPLPYIPRDLMVAGSTPFDPTLDAQVDARVSDGTSPITLVSSNVIGDLIGIVGISGGLRVTVTPSMVTEYRTTTAHLGTASATSATHELSVTRPTAGFDDSIELPVSLAGIVRYAPTLTFAARFDIKIFGYRVVDWELFQVPMTLPALERKVTMTSDTPAHFALPVLDGLGEGARIDFASGATQLLAIRNRGELALTIDPASVPAGVTVEAIDIAPGASAQLRVTATDDAFATGSKTLLLATSDPDHAQISIELGREVGGTDPGMVEDEPEAGGCSTGGSSTGGVVGLIALVVIRRRRKA
ncbi:MAG: hypothetical protein H0V17_26095 [Deltaproteobacteria bacterium]|nr:hypothetical protein [Deltaproteobacteria bacterium]